MKRLQTLVTNPGPIRWSWQVVGFALETLSRCFAMRWEFCVGELWSTHAKILRTGFFVARLSLAVSLPFLCRLSVVSNKQDGWFNRAVKPAHIWIISIKAYRKVIKSWRPSISLSSQCCRRTDGVR
jgi:hypothetical protein